VFKECVKENKTTSERMSTDRVDGRGLGSISRSSHGFFEKIIGVRYFLELRRDLEQP
jgi:hypothetical protein